MRLLSKRTALVLASLGVTAGIVAGESALAGVAPAGPESAPAAREGFSMIPGSLPPTTDVDMGAFTSPKMTVEIVLAPRSEAELSALLQDVYNANSPRYQQWLVKGEFYTRFAPSSAQIDAVADHLQASGLVIEQSSPFLVRASGPSSAVEAAFATTLRNYRNAKGVTYFANASALQLPASLAAGVRGVVGVTNTLRARPQIRRSLNRVSSAGSPVPSAPACDTPYPTPAQLFGSYVSGISFPYGYGDGPGCSGLTPSQDNAIYGAPELGAVAKGLGVNLAVFELSAYQHSDIATWAHYFYGPHYTPPLVDIDVDGGPLTTSCPAGDTCYPGYIGDIEVDADLEMQLAIAPAAAHILVYNAPADDTGQTELDEYTRIANDDLADVVSSSWAYCENGVTPGFVQAENIVFEQMALQGQSMFASAGDSGAFECAPYPTGLDPASQPWVTAVGGTSFDSFNPDANPNPSYPTGVETVWNVDNLCSDASPNSANDEQGGLFWCYSTGAGGGGSSQYWGRPIYQFGPGITNPYTTYGNGTTQCALAKIGMPCREIPDVSANADEFTPYAEYCTGNASTPESVCATFSGSQIPPGWFGIGGTSLSSPFWSAIIADRDAFLHGRTGNANPLLYFLYNVDYYGFFHDITGIDQTTNNNGYFPTTPGYDLATGIGTPKMGAIITGVPER